MSHVFNIFFLGYVTIVVFAAGAPGKILDCLDKAPNISRGEHEQQGRPPTRDQNPFLATKDCHAMLPQCRVSSYCHFAGKIRNLTPLQMRRKPLEVIRVITAIFLSQTLEAANNDVDLMIQERIRKKSIFVEQLESRGAEGAASFIFFVSSIWE